MTPPISGSSDRGPTSREVISSSVAQRGRVAAIVVTFKRDEQLRSCLKGLAKTNVDAVFIVDNANRTTCAIAAKENEIYGIVYYLPQQENLGGSGGFAAGMRAALDQGFDLLWLMDDDCEPAVDSLRNLLKTFSTAKECGIQPAFVASRVLWVDDSDHLMNKPPIIESDVVAAEYGFKEVRSASFVSILVSRQLVDLAGLPIPDFFIWFDDTEYTMRLRRFGTGLLARDSLVVHATDANNTGSFRHLSDENYWKYQYALPNLIATLLTAREYTLLLRTLVSASFGIIRAHATVGTKTKVLLRLTRLPRLILVTQAEWKRTRR